MVACAGAAPASPPWKGGKLAGIRTGENVAGITV